MTRHPHPGPSSLAIIPQPMPSSAVALAAATDQRPQPSSGTGPSDDALMTVKCLERLAKKGLSSKSSKSSRVALYARVRTHMEGVDDFDDFDDKRYIYIYFNILGVIKASSKLFLFDDAIPSYPGHGSGYLAGAQRRILWGRL
jgi:hypothetical protein